MKKSHDFFFFVFWHFLRKHLELMLLPHVCGIKKNQVQLAMEGFHIHQLSHFRKSGFSGITR